jgi:hypothetical protein
LDRFKIYKILKDNISKIENEDLRERVDVLLSPLYLYCLGCFEKNIELFYWDLSFKSKIQQLPNRIKQKIKDWKAKLDYLIARKINNDKTIQGKIVFYPIEPTHLKQMLPVSNHLKKSEYIYITERLSIYKNLIRLNIECLLIPKKVAFTKFDFDYLELVKGIIPTDLYLNWISFSKYQIENRYEEIKLSISNALNLLKPQKLIIGYDITAEGRFCVKYGKKHNIPTICIQHGSIAGEPMDGEHIVDHYLLYGNKAKQYLIEIGNKTETLKVFGAPYLDDEIFNKKSNEDTLIELDLKLKSNTILVALSGPGHCTTFEHFNQIVISLVQFAKANTKVNMIFKLHRKDSIKNYEPIFNQIGYSCPIIESTDTRFPNDIFFWLNVSDVLITGSSTVALEAMLKGKPVVTVDYQNQYQNIDFIDLNCTHHVSEETQLSPTISIALKQSGADEISFNAKQYINEYFYSEEKPASLRIAEWLIKAS